MQALWSLIMLFFVRLSIQTALQFEIVMLQSEGPFQIGNATLSLFPSLSSLTSFLCLQVWVCLLKVFFFFCSLSLHIFSPLPLKINHSNNISILPFFHSFSISFISLVSVVLRLVHRAEFFFASGCTVKVIFSCLWSYMKSPKLSEDVSISSNP